MKYLFRYHAETWTDVLVDAESKEEAYELADDCYNNDKNIVDSGFEICGCEIIEGDEQ